MSKFQTSLDDLFETMEKKGMDTVDQVRFLQDVLLFNKREKADE